MITRRIRRSPWSLLFLVPTGLALLVAGAAVWFLLPPPRPTARAQVYVPLNPAEDRLCGQEFLLLQAYLIKDRFVLDAALNDEQVRKADLSVLRGQPDPLRWLENEVKVDFPGPEFIQISLSGDRPEDLLVLVNAVRRSYLHHAGDKGDSEHSKKIDALGIKTRTPARVREFGDGSIYIPDPFRGKLWSIAPVSLAGLGVVLLAFTGIRFLSPDPPDLQAADAHPATY
jgi:hypothetical protein